MVIIEGRIGLIWYLLKRSINYVVTNTC